MVISQKPLTTVVCPNLFWPSNSSINAPFSALPLIVGVFWFVTLSPSFFKPTSVGIPGLVVSKVNLTKNSEILPNLSSARKFNW